MLEMLIDFLPVHGVRQLAANTAATVESAIQKINVN